MAVQSITIPPGLALVLNSAGQKNDVDFDYLLQTAIRESSLNPVAKAKTSSATGLFQFLEATWLEIMKSEGERLGYATYANAISRDSKGNFIVKDNKLRMQILELRNDPQVASDLAAAFTRNNGEYLKARFGRMPSAGELYIAHFLGAKGAERMFEAGLKNPEQIAANLFPKAAKANRAIFYANGEARTIKQVYQALVAKHKVNSTASEFAVQQFANNANSPEVLSKLIAPRVVAPNIAFENMYSSKPVKEPRSLINKTELNNNGGFFVQLYSK